jgi:hypothetical protein
MRILPLFTLAAVVVAFSACERADPVQSDAPVAPPRLTVAGSSLGSMIVPTLPTNDPSARGEIAFQPTGIVIPDSTEVEVRVSGVLRATTNPAWKAAYCDNPDIVGGHPWACSPADRTNFDLYWKGNSDHQLMAKVGVRGADGQVRTFWLSQRAGQDPNIGFVTISVPGQLMVARTGSGLVFGPAQDVYGKTIPAMGALKLASAQQLTAVITADLRQPGVGLNCPSFVQRGSSTNCTLTHKPVTAALTDVVWTFTDAAGNVSHPPAGTTTSWGGIMVVGGAMRVQAKVAGTGFDTTAAIAVSARPWAQLSLQATVIGQDNLPTWPQRLNELTNTDIFPPATYPVQRIGSGPNTGWWYLSAALPAVRVVHRWSNAWQPLDPWYKWQTGGSHPSGNGNWCGPSDMPTVEQLAREHEGISAGPLPSHQSVLRDYFARFSATADVDSTSPQAKLERFRVYGTTTADTATADSAISATFEAAVRSSALAEPRQQHYNPQTTSPGNPGVVPLVLLPCHLRW